ncbi:MAG: hypothetical protein AAGE96_15325 [Cyanobacteria bacterium P01_G01_bin.19]
MNNKSHQRDRKYLSSWQIRKMQSIIEDRWQEVWQVAQARDLGQNSRAKNNYDIYL